MSNGLLLSAAHFRRIARRARWVVVAVLLALVSTTIATIDPPESSAAPSRLPAAPRDRVIPHTDFPLTTKAAAAPAGGAARAATRWPAAGSAEVVLGARPLAERGNASERGLGAAAHQAGDLPVRVAAGAASRSGESTVRVRVAERSIAERSGVAGVVLALASAKGTTDSAAVTVDYSSFRHAGGGDFGGRARLVRLPDCVLTTPEVPACQVQTPIDSRNDPASQSVTAAGLPLAKPAVLALTAAAQGANGQFTASSLEPSGSWGVTGSTGAFTWSYPITVPPVAAGTAPTPKIGLSYNSASVDGRTAATNNQSSWIGQGWEYSPGFIERSYRSCSDDTTLPQAQQTGDLCWAGQIVTMSLSGHSTSLIRNDADGTWRPASDDGTRVELLTGVSNGARNGEHWRITTTDGTQYYFGRNDGPGRTTQDTTNSTWTTRVYGPRNGDPCYNAAGFAQSQCNQAWRWNLDYVEDTHGNAALYYYTPETNYYSANNGTTGIQYTRGGTLKRIDYGLRKTSGSVYTGTVPGQVTFDVTERCTPSGAITCAPAQFTAANAASWPDTPQDQQCLSGTTCNNHSPSFWSTKRLTTITTQYNTGTGPIKVDSYALTQTFPTLGDPELRLDQLVRTAYTSAGVGTASTPVTFSSQLLDNRVAGYNGQPAMAHWRLTDVASETGGHYNVSYLPAECTAATVPTDLPNNAKRCYPVYWTLPLNQNPTLDFFHIYPVSRVELQDGNGVSPTQRTDYSYLGTPAWHYDDNELVKPANRTYGQFRGYGQVETRTGNPGNLINGVPDAQTLSKTTYFRGMNGDRLPGNQQRSVSITNSLGETYPDDDQFAGTPHEVQGFLGSGGAQLSTSLTQVAKLATTATRARTGLPAATADIVATTRTREITTLAAGGVRTVSATNRYDAVGRKVSTSSTADGLPDQCTTVSYADNTTSWIRDRVAQTWSSAAACPTTGPVVAPAPIASSQRQYYDQQTTLGAVTGAGDATASEAATANAGGTLTFQTTATSTFDASGRTVSQKDALNRETQTTYTPADGGIVSQIETKNPKNQTASVVLEPSRGNAVHTVDVGNRATDATYDVFGRATAVWNPGRSKTAGDSPNIEYLYLLRTNGPLAVTTRTLVDYGTGTNYVTSISLLDAFGRQRQTQADDMSDPTGVNNRVVAETVYDSHGWVVRSHNRYVTTGAPSTTLVSVPDASVDDRTVTGYDAAGRSTSQTSYQGATAKATATTVYGGDRTTTFPPTGGVIRTVITDARGNNTELRDYKTPPTVTGNVVTGGTAVATTFHYNALNQLDRSTDAVGDKWEYEYDFLGRRVGLTDPDTGHSTTAYDAAGQITATTDGRGQVLSYDNDVLGRRTAEYSGVGAGRVKLASWAFDTATGGVGKLASTTRYTANGNYLVGVSGYNSLGLPQNNVVQVPTYDTGLNGLYTTTFSYTTTGQPTGVALPTKGGLPGEAITFVVNKYGNPAETRSNVWDYVSGSTYSAYGEGAQYQLSSGNNAGTLTYERDPRTHVVDHTNLSVQRATPLVDDLRYTYDPAGNLTKIVNGQGAPANTTRTQCFGYDSLDRLNHAWTATDNCTGQPSTTPGAVTVGGASPYWTSWTHNDIGLRTGQTQHGIGQADTTTSYTYPTPGAGVARPHALTSTAVSGPGGTNSSTFGYDNAGNTSTRTVNGSAHTLTWTENNRLAKVQSPSGDTTYVYDADGKQLIRREPGKVILYLPGQEFARDTASGTVTGTRYYSHNGVVVARRVGGASPEYLQTDHHSTAQVAVSGVGFAVTRREFDPYGNQLGAVQGGPWADNRGFLNMPANSSTGLVDIGARPYDPVLGRFASVDPDFDIKDPRTWTGYAYATGNPTSGWDPTGLYQECGPACFYEGPGWQTDPAKYQRINDERAAKAEAKANLDRLPKIPPERMQRFREQAEMIIKQNPDSWNDPASHANRALMRYARTAFYGKATAGDYWDAFKGFAVSTTVALVGLALCPETGGLACMAAVGAVSGMAGQCVEDCSDVSKMALSAVVGAVLGAAPGVRWRGGEPIIPPCNSFVPGTQVVLADGSHRAIEDLRIGDLVLATDPATGEVTARPVTATILGKGLKHLVDVSVEGGDDPGHLVATDGHPFWVVGKGAFVRADHLAAGDELRTPAGGTRVVLGTRAYWVLDQQVHNLTVATDHTYYVLAGGTPVLVHNCNGIALGFREVEAGDMALFEFSDRVGARAYTDWPSMGDNWVNELKGFVTDGKTPIHFNLDGIGAANAKAFAEKGRGVNPNGGEHATAWELSYIQDNPSSWSRVTFYENGKPVANPFGQ
ncbi:polymorphic toxin-type HINT domain-containing protein [Actinokineospora diospyrosa]|uniref:RHS repeat-associated core domain-containing protein n=1 Tax=Actinokineospora diospyrosa TaxID=103728 RepID=A0ABT1IEP9_9PSEU|nr:polymorphic toxin-type HINT domain-containing protein [Actinokineospora diospyrosa]MCP2271109.1 RHS repeat-associated core domain-containing protein [Actinokineospora diospyrosa]